MAEVTTPTTTTTSNEISSRKGGRITDNLRRFYAQHGVDVDRLKTTGSEACFASRFVRLNPRFVDSQETLAKLKKELQDHQLAKNSSGSSSSAPPAEPLPVPWLDETLGFYGLPGDFALSQSPCYQEGRIYGMDVSSGAAVAALISDQYDKNNKKEETTANNSPQQRRRVLDLCCAPGLKLCALADYLEAGVVVGVDVSEHRIATTKRILHKYRMMPQTGGNNNNPPEGVRIRLYCGDGTTFDQPQTKLPTLVFDSQTAWEESAVQGKRKRMNKSARARERKRLKSLETIDFYPPHNGNDEKTQQPSSDPNGSTASSWKALEFDCVLVDAECSTDGSLKHIQKQIHNQQQPQVAPLLTDAAQLAQLVDLQKQLAAAGFRMLKPGGVMVYSTCSLSTDQNETVVEWLLQEFGEAAFMIPLDFTSNDKHPHPKIKHGPWGVRFEPSMKQSDEDNNFESTAPPMVFGGGFFLAKIGKKATMETQQKS